MNISTSSRCAFAFASLVSCGGTLQQVQGAQFSLNVAESSLADQYSQADPVQAPPQVRCQYWGKRTMEASRGHQIGMVIWPPQHFVTLHEWTQAKQAEVCAAARLAAQQLQAKAAQERQEEATRRNEEAMAASKAAALRQKEEATKAALSTLGNAEQGLRTMTPPWTDAKIDTFKQLRYSLESVTLGLSAGRLQFSVDDQARATAAVAAFSAIASQPAYMKAEAALEARKGVAWRQEQARQTIQRQQEAQSQARCSSDCAKADNDCRQNVCHEMAGNCAMQCAQRHAECDKHCP